MPRSRALAPVLMLALAFSLAPAAAPPPAFAQAGVTLGKSGYPLPRFVSLKSRRVNVRVGPGQNYKVKWIYTKPGLPLEVTQEFDTWRRVRDSEGGEGWVFHSLLSGVRTALVAPWGQDEPEPVRTRPNSGARVTALLQSGVLAEVKTCRQEWCRVEGDGFKGWVAQDLLWGVYQGEEID